jgi:omega-6 fatty acid desaturase (delta-12 desaturase)
LGKNTLDTQTANQADRELFKATMPFGVESVSTSWWVVGSTFVLLLASLLGAALAPVWPLQLAFSVLSALLMVRAFITYHDYMHNAILSRSRFAWWLFRLYSALALTPPRSWRHSHNFHHGHVGNVDAAATGTFALMTTDMWRNASLKERFAYRVERHPLTILAGYFTIFFLGVTIVPFFKNPARHWDSLLVLFGHIGLIAALWVLGGFATAFFVILLPMTIASMIGSFLFFAQHSFEDMRILTSEEWTSRRAAVESSSYLKLGKTMSWFTGNIGYHHIHHLNVRIPFYRLPEAMAEIAELQEPATITLSLKDIRACFRCCLWDEKLQRMVSFREFASSPAAA